MPSQQTETTTLRKVCEECGAPAEVHVSGKSGGGDTMRHFCAACLEKVTRREAKPYYGSGNAFILVTLGLAFFLISLFADSIRFGGSAGFGPYQTLGAVCGGCLVVMGGMAKIKTFLYLGILIAGLSILADWLKLGGNEGFGTQQILGCLFGLVVMCAGIQIARSRAI